MLDPCGKLAATLLQNPPWLLMPARQAQYPSRSKHPYVGHPGSMLLNPSCPSLSIQLARSCYPHYRVECDSINNMAFGMQPFMVQKAKRRVCARWSPQDQACSFAYMSSLPDLVSWKANVSWKASLLLFANKHATVSVIQSISDALC